MRTYDKPLEVFSDRADCNLPTSGAWWEADVGEIKSALEFFRDTAVCHADILAARDGLLSLERLVEKIK